MGGAKKKRAKPAPQVQPMCPDCGKAPVWCHTCHRCRECCLENRRGALAKPISAEVPKRTPSSACE